MATPKPTKKHFKCKNCPTTATILISSGRKIPAPGSCLGNKKNNGSCGPHIWELVSEN